MRAFCLRPCATLVLLAFASLCSAQQLVVGAGASLSLGSSVVDAGCRDLQLDGTLDIASGTIQSVRDVGSGGQVRGGSGTLSLSGDLALGAALQAENGTVRVTDGCGRNQSRVVGEHQFHRLSVQTSDTHSLVLPAGSTQMIASALELLGGTQRLVLRSSAPGAVSFLALATAGAQSISRVDAQDVGAPTSAQFLAPNLPSFYDSLDQGNTPRFFLGDDELIKPVPALSLSGAVLLLFSMLAMAAIQLRASARGGV